MMNLKGRFDASSTSLNLDKFCSDESKLLKISLYTFNILLNIVLALQLYYPLYEPKTMLHVMSFSASYSPKKLSLQNNFLKDANSIYPLNKMELVYLDLRNNEVIHF